jgi:serine protease Do
MSEVERDLTALGAKLRASTVRVYDGERGSGSGVVWSPSGLIVTSAHVVRGRFAEVEFEDGRRARGAVVRRDDARDLAVVRVGGAGLRHVAVRDSRTLLPGELVVAVGNPLGLVGAVCAGVVQRRNPRWVVADVRLAPGNSGGPLADGTGRVVGINSLIYDGLAFAVPAEAVAQLLAA